MISLLVTLLLSLNTQATPLSILVIDSGINEKYVHKICAAGNKSFIKDVNYNKDIEIPHGTNVVSIIENTAQIPGYCIIMYKVFAAEKNYDIEDLLSALREAKKHKFDIINLSLGGYIENAEEKKLVQDLLDQGSIIVTAAGNDKVNLDKNCNWFPACYDSRIIVVGSTDNKGLISDFSNYGFIKQNLIFVRGEKFYGAEYIMSGTSQAAAYFTGGLIKYILKYKIDLKPKRTIQSFTMGDKSKVGQALYIQLGMKEYESEFLKWYYANVPDQIKLIAGWSIPIYKAYNSGILIVEKKF